MKPTICSQQLSLPCMFHFHMARLAKPNEIGLSIGIYGVLKKLEPSDVMNRQLIANLFLAMCAFTFLGNNNFHTHNPPSPASVALFPADPKRRIFSGFKKPSMFVSAYLRAKPWSLNTVTQLCSYLPRFQEKMFSAFVTFELNRRHKIGVVFSEKCRRLGSSFWTHDPRTHVPPPHATPRTKSSAFDFGRYHHHRLLANFAMHFNT